jgi:predicted Zn-dependent protease
MHFRSALLCALLSVAACAPNPHSVSSLTSNNPSYLASEGERKLVAQSEQVHREFINQGLLVNDENATAYINTVAKKFRPSLQQGPELHYYILRDSNLNAMAFPNGNIYINAGLIVRLDSEDQLALVLAHETAHVVQRHGYKGSLDRQNTVIAAHVTDLLLAGTGIAYLPAALNLASFSREQEKEADLEGIKYLEQTDYNLEDSIKIFDKLVVVKYADRNSSVWSSHPDLVERKKYTTQLINSSAKEPSAPPQSANYEAIRKRMADIVIQLHLQNGQYELATDAADYEISKQGDAAQWHLYKGDAKRSMAEHPDRAAKENAWLYNKSFNADLTRNFSQQAPEYFQEASNEYQRALLLNNKLAPAVRGMGLVALGQDNKVMAKNYLTQYLEMSPDKPNDKRYIENLLSHLTQ